MDVVLFNQKKSSSMEVMRFQNRSSLNTRKDASINPVLKLASAAALEMHCHFCRRGKEKGTPRL